MFYDSPPRRRAATARKVVIVDWDDTILPSTFVDRWRIENSKDLPPHVSSRDEETARRERGSEELRDRLRRRVALRDRSSRRRRPDFSRFAPLSRSSSRSFVRSFVRRAHEPSSPPSSSSSQFQSLLGELSRCAEAFLREASKYGEVRSTVAVVSFRAFLPRISSAPSLPWDLASFSPRAFFSTSKYSNAYLSIFVVGTLPAGGPRHRKSPKCCVCRGVAATREFRFFRANGNSTPRAPIPNFLCGYPMDAFSHVLFLRNG